MNPANRTISITLIIIFVDKNSDTSLNFNPLSFNNSKRFAARCTTRKVHKNKPARPIKSFLPIEELRNLSIPGSSFRLKLLEYLFYDNIYIVSQI